MRIIARASALLSPKTHRNPSYFSRILLSLFSNRKSDTAPIWVERIANSLRSSGV
nr:MAG TPA: hypothetical protein [Microviridae sp.]